MPIIDTNILVHNIREDRLSRIIQARYLLMGAVTPPMISIVTEGEIRGLALQFNWSAGKQQRMQYLLDYLIIVPLPFRGVVEAYAEIDDYSRRIGVSMGKNDIWIAATAHVTETRLLTTDKDFDHLHTIFLERDWIDPLLPE